jgi:spore coat protein CotH
MRRLRHRIPVRLRHHWKVVAACGAFFAVLVGAVGASRVAPLVTSDERADVDVVTEDVPGRVELLDASRPHQLSLSFADEDYQRMLEQFSKDGSKEYVQADLVIDGTFVPDVGIRLKGNSTLRSLSRGATSAFQAPESLPWLLSFDKYAKGRRYQGHTEVAVRPPGMGRGTSLNEAIALTLVAESGEPSQQFAFSSFTVNGRPAVTRLLVEHPDKAYAKRLAGDGVLYKSLAGSQFTDQGDDQTAYRDDFDQVNKKGSQDLQPVIELIQWVARASDAEFAAGLADRVDVDSFARYVALQNLLLNFDDMAGPGRNYYLWLDAGTGRFRVVAWDHNLTFSGTADQGPYDGGRMGGGRFGGHRLKERALASAAFKPVYEQAYRDLYRRVYAGARALSTLDAITKVLGTVGGNDPATTAADAERLRTLLVARTQSLATDPVITGT